MRLLAAMKGTHGRSDAASQEEVMGQKPFSGLHTDDPDILELSKDGFDAFAERTAERILADNKEQIVLNYCPRCKELARTPKARQCRFCGHDWHTAETTPFH
jgi:hypothetical protein